MVSPVFEKGMSAHLKGRNRFLNVMTHDVVERLKIRRKALATDAGLDESYDVGTYPPGVETVNITKGTNPIAAAVLTSVLLGTGGAGALGAANLLGMFDKAAPAAAVAPEDQVFDVIIEGAGHGGPNVEVRPDTGRDPGEVPGDPRGLE